MSDVFKHEFAKIFSRQAQNHTASIALLQVVLPVSLAVLSASTGYLWDLSHWLVIALWVILVVFWILSWWKSHPNYSDIHRLLLQKQNDDSLILDLNNEASELKSIVNNLYLKNIASFSYRAMSVKYIQEIKNNGIDHIYFNEVLDEILSPIYLQGDMIFGFKISEKWNVSVYFHQKDARILKSVWRRKSSSHPSLGLGRDWVPGEGHVGKAFIDRRPIFTGDANDDSVAQLCRARGSKQLHYDNIAYVSFASVPISISEDDDCDPYGVLVVTSDIEDRFAEASLTEFLMHAAETIAVVLEVSGADIGCLVNANHDIYGKTNGEHDVGSNPKI
ncbi:hypothetical protein JM93_03391 [Roseibium hamelinense]|uniref:GAF domain-containing protein n=1 Tax=Roseibium hamelinense TaxID=150831 RepID=A0A562SQ41_9HYPH|nr:GAF domain-containing protein [Roseibium hamelinense]MTI44347.1 GAF domain-containing protein [Roseibium hamelinense]TWI82876.1 hypothetical protein JM93_03391 [Roseibium hamelinense]